MEDDAETLDELSQAPWKQGADRDWAKQIALLDLTKVRASKYSASAPPSGAQQAERPADRAGADRDGGDGLENIVACGVRLEDGRQRLH
eukprot:4295649-Pyramimonas_sp.AAC.1